MRKAFTWLMLGFVVWLRAVTFNLLKALKNQKWILSYPTPSFLQQIISLKLLPQSCVCSLLSTTIEENIVKTGIQKLLIKARFPGGC